MGMNLKEDKKAYAIMGCAMRVHRILGDGFLESAYGDALEVEFARNGIPYVREDDLRVFYDGVPPEDIRRQRRSGGNFLQMKTTQRKGDGKAVEESRDSPAPKASGCLSAKREPRRGRKGPSKAER